MTQYMVFHEDVEFKKGFYFFTGKHLPTDQIALRVFQVVLLEFFQWLPERSWPYQSFCASSSCPTSRLFQSPH